MQSTRAWKLCLISTLLHVPPLNSMFTHVWRGKAHTDANTHDLTYTHTHTWKVTVNKRSIYHHCHKSDAGSSSSIWRRPILAQEREISCLFLLSMLPIWFPITSNSNQQQRRGDLRECACVCVCKSERERERTGERKKGKGAKRKGEENSREEKQSSEGCSVRQGEREREREDKIT